MSRISGPAHARIAEAEPRYLKWKRILDWAAIVSGPAMATNKDNPEMDPDDVFEVDVPGYDMRRLIQARDPLCAANAFFVQVRGILATMLGLRMCAFCPHCNKGSRPCQDAFGTSGELMGGIAGRGGALFGAVECQKCKKEKLSVQKNCR